MRAGLYRDRITIEQPSATRQTNGEEVPTWSTFATAWASVQPQMAWRRSGEGIHGEIVQGMVSAIVSMRYRAGITPDMRIIWDGHTYDIEAVIDIGGLHAELQMMCVERLAAAV